MSLWIGTSWKMNKRLAEALDFANALKRSPIISDPRVQPFIMPPFTALREIAAALTDERVVVGAQNMHWADSGAWTGEISAPMLQDCGATLVELGHAERRAHFGETDHTVALKVEAAVRHGLTPLICIGEAQRDRESGQTHNVLETQVRAALQKLDDSQKKAPILLVYEPLWAIGENGVPAPASYAEESQARIVETAEAALGRRIPCLYGGSVSLDNCVDLVSQPHIDGLFIGRSAWQAQEFVEILTRCAGVV